MTHLHGPVPLDDEFYCERPFETELARQVTAGRWVLLLGPRQHGKTSALIRLKSKLRDMAMHVALVDLQKLPPVDDYAQLVAWFANRIAVEFGIGPSIEPTSDLSEALAVAVPDGRAPILVIVDEASNIHDDDRRNAFYGQLRSIATERGDLPEDHVAARLRFVFAGTFREERLVAEENSPFNTCVCLDTSDLGIEGVVGLARQANISEAAKLGAIIFDEVGGQPYLVQKLIDAIQAEDSEAVLANEIVRLRTGQSEHMRHLFRRVLEEESLCAIVSTLIRDGTVPYEPGDDDQRYLIVLGLLTLQEHRLAFRNNLYRHIASFSPQLANAQQGDGATSVVMLTYPRRAFSGFTDQRLAEVAFSAQLGAVGAHQAGSNRLALAGFGNALEALLLDYLLKQTSADIATASTECRGSRAPFFDATDPGTWVLADMMRGARKLAGVAGPEIPESLRDWRNLVHPSVCLRDYRPDETYLPELVTAAGLFGMVLRDLR